ncbi:hypothetical protein PG994_008983 [Apiospora phragmitis]|uniref:Uncharacterized protein n=1 Tax=Apiospora phragmitis TaxID=2905665 RepID=A0ABR1UKE4_9PEZI
METVNSMAAAAAKAVWGENDTATTANNETHGQEPISGAQGDVSKVSPSTRATSPNAASVNSHEPSTTTTKPTTSTADSTHQASTTTPTTSTTTGPRHDSSAQFAKTTGTAAEADKVPDNKYTEMKSKDTPADSSKAQNDTRDPENPSTHPKNAPTDVDNTGEGINKGQDLDKMPAPKPLDELARERGGDAGKVGDTGKGDGGIIGDEKKDEAEGKEDPNDPHAKSTGEGTGEKYVKTSGVKADGGDFDATKPGAGREADRLLEQKGIHVTKGVPPKPEDEGAADKASADKDSASGEKGEKKGIPSKIKEKLHRH